MKILNLGCGGVRPKGSEWINLDDLLTQLPEGSPERLSLEAEGNYVNHVISPVTGLPFESEWFDGCLASHFFEHWDCQDATHIMRECRRVLKPGGVLLVSVPNASYFREVYHEDRNENWPRLFEVSDPPNPIPTWHQAALWFDQHKAILTEDALWSYFTHSGFTDILRWTKEMIRIMVDGESCAKSEMAKHLNRLPFSLVMSGTKP